MSFLGSFLVKRCSIDLLLKCFVLMFWRCLQSSKMCFTVSVALHGLHWGGSSPLNRCECVQYVCPILVSVTSVFLFVCGIGGVIFTVGLINFSLELSERFQRFCHASVMCFLIVVLKSVYGTVQCS